MLPHALGPLERQGKESLDLATLQAKDPLLQDLPHGRTPSHGRAGAGADPQPWNQDHGHGSPTYLPT